ncbi:MAG: homocysteine S-methyltransferase family protein, partial [Deltaproteobacteria bacterium]|nr:homocysteine S-methyltransferase family protein [Deltaproteobacteria bacterium]
MRREEIVLLDGAVGTSLWEKADDKVPVWRYNMENPKIVTELAAEYADAGAQIILANTFGANRLAMKRTDYTVRQIVSTAVGLTRDAVGKRAKVALAVGPLPVLMEPYGDLTEEDAFELFDEQ